MIENSGRIVWTEATIRRVSQDIYARASRGGPFEPTYEELPERIKDDLRHLAMHWLASVIPSLEINPMRAQMDKTDVGVRLSAEMTHAEVVEAIKEAAGDPEQYAREMQEVIRRNAKLAHEARDRGPLL